MELNIGEIKLVKDKSEAGKTDILKVNTSIQLPRLEFKQFIVTP